jgi:pimeloyl-ACP methyl ester carboxylesterase
VDVLSLPDGRRLDVYDTGPAPGPTVLWHHGSPQTGALLDPLVAATRARDMRLVSYARPSYGTSTPQPGRTVAAAGTDVAAIADALGLDRLAMMGASGGGPHALAGAAALLGRVVGVVTIAGIAPPTEDFDWYAGMRAPDGLRAAADGGRAERAAFAETEQFDGESFIAADYAALAGPWRSLGADAGRAGEAGPDGLIDDDVAFTRDWRVDLVAIDQPVLVVQGGLDRVVPPGHAHWLVEHLAAAQLWLRPRDGHVSVLAAVPVALDWLREL